MFVKVEPSAAVFHSKISEKLGQLRALLDEITAVTNEGVSRRELVVTKLGIFLVNWKLIVNQELRGLSEVCSTFNGRKSSNITSTTLLVFHEFPWDRFYSRRYVDDSCFGWSGHCQAVSIEGMRILVDIYSGRFCSIESGLYFYTRKRDLPQHNLRLQFRVTYSFTSQVNPS